MDYRKVFPIWFNVKSVITYSNMLRDLKEFITTKGKKVEIINYPQNFVKIFK